LYGRYTKNGKRNGDKRKMKLSGELDYRIRYDVEHDLFHAQNVFNDEYIAPTFIEYVQKLEKENEELRKVAEFQQSSNMSRHFENKKLKEGLAVGSIFNKALNSMNKALEEERDKYREMTFDMKDQLTNAKEIIKKLLSRLNRLTYTGLNCKECKEAEQFLNSDIKEG
jgi:hypothetical protein